MEEILASIRRIIADDDASKAQRVAEPYSSAAGPPATEPPPSPAAPRTTAPEPAKPEPPPDPPIAASEPEQEDAIDQAGDILDLTESMAAPAPEPAPEPEFRTVDGNFDVSYDDMANRPAPQANGGMAGLHPYTGDTTPLLSQQTSAAVDSAFNTLAQTVLVQNARTLEDLVREMLRPMLKSWLDDNLPGLVERLVRAEIERVSRGRIG